MNSTGNNGRAQNCLGIVNRTTSPYGRGVDPSPCSAERLSSYSFAFYFLRFKTINWLVRGTSSVVEREARLGIFTRVDHDSIAVGVGLDRFLRRTI